MDGYEEAKWGAEYQGDSKDETFAYKVVASTVLRVGRRRREQVLIRSWWLLTFSARGKLPKLI